MQPAAHSRQATRRVPCSAILVGKAAGDEKLFETKRKRAALDEKLGAIREEQRVAALRKRPVYAEPGSIELPRLVLAQLTSSTAECWTIPDLGLLCAVLLSFENRTPIFADASFEEQEGEPVLVIRGGDTRLLPPAIGGDSFSGDGSGFVRLRPALSLLSRSGWLRIARTPSELCIGLGEQAKTLRTGGSQASASA